MDSFDVTEAQKVAIFAARAAGEIMNEYRGRKFSVERKGEIDLVTEVDLLCEKAIVSMIREKFPDHGVLAEEGGAEKGASRFKWIIDPIDGTTNYAHGFPVYCASIAFEIDGKVVTGAVYDPSRDEMFTAIKGGGATLNDSPIKVSETSEIIKALLATGFPYEIKTTARNNISEFTRFAMSAQAIRRPGAAALDLCYVACGRIDGFWEFHLKPWDMAAGALFVSEAGGRVSMAGGEELEIYQPDIVASNGLLHEAMLEILSEAG